jgi:hypothetical protein
MSVNIPEELYRRASEIAGVEKISVDDLLRPRLKNAYSNSNV